MLSPAVESNCNSGKLVNPAAASSATTFPRILAYVDTSQHAETLVPHAVAVAEALGAPLTLLRVLDVPHETEVPPDPVEWSLRRREALRQVKRLAKQGGEGIGRIDAAVVEGPPAEQICLWARDHDVGLTVVGTGGGEGSVDWEGDEIARKLVDRASGSLLLVPSSASQLPTGQYRRLLVPLDGSCRAESVLPLAMRLAKASGAELLLAHVIPTPEFTETGPLEAEDHQLLEQIARRNDRVARQYLDRIRARVVQSGLAARNVIVRNGDVRSSLVRLVAEEGVDMLVLSSQGRSGRTDVSCGSVASYMVTHTVAPLLIVLRSASVKRGGASVFPHPRGRLPSRRAS